MKNKCEMIKRKNGEIFFRPKYRNNVKFQDEIYADIFGNENEGYVVYTVERGKGHHLGIIDKDAGFISKWSKDLAIKKAKEWMDKKGFSC